MTVQDEASSNPKGEINLKFPEQDVLSQQPWHDDLLDRARIADVLTRLIESQSNPFTMSIHGYWGTGKTFLLKRWQKELENAGFKAIYFNAWEDDFCDDPLLSIIGQLSDYFKAGSLKRLALRASRYVGQLIVANVSHVTTATVGVPLKVDHQENQSNPLVDTYLEQKKIKDQLKTELSKLSEQVTKQTKHPLIFIVDELDRCRPTFAIELLERVKHIFDVPNIVFVFGVNRDELCKSLKSIYGDIEADVYLRRFFDLEFNLPKANSEAFTRNMMGKYALGSLEQPDHISRLHGEFDVLIQDMPTLWSHLDLSLRDIDYCVRLVTFVAASLRPGQPIFPYILGLLVALRVENPVLFDEFVAGKRRGSRVMDYIDESIPIREQYSHLQEVLLRIEAHLYLSDKRFGMSKYGYPLAVEQLTLLQSDSELTQPELLSNRTGKVGGDPNRLIQLIERFESSSLIGPSPAFPPTAIRYVASLIDLNEDLIKR